MRKFTLFLMSLFLAVGAMAQTATTHEDGVYKIYWDWNDRGYLTYHAEYPNDPQLAGVELSGCQTKHYALTDAGIQLSWYLYTSKTTGKSYLFEATTGKFITINTGVTVGNGKKCVLSTEVTEQAQLDLKATTNEANGYMLSYDRYNFCSGCGSAKGQNPVRFATDGQTDGGIPFVFVSEGASITDEVKDAAIAKIIAFETVIEASYKLVDQAGNIYEGNFNYNSSNAPTITGVHGYTLTNVDWNETESLYTATINFPYPVSKVGGATNETLLAQFSNKYWHADGNGVKVQTTGVKAIDTNCLWAIYPTFDNGNFTFAIMNVATGKYIYTEATAAVHNTENTIILNDTPTMFTIASDKDWKVYNKNLYLSINSTNDTNVWLGIYDSTHNGTNVTAIKLNEYKVAVTEAKYATFYAPVAVTVPAGVTAHTVTIDGERAVLSEALTIIPAYTGVILYSETAATYTFAITNEEVDAIENNALLGTVATTQIAEENTTYYILANGTNGIGLYPHGTEHGNFQNNSHKAYLPVTGTQGALSYGFTFGGTTAIEGIEATAGEKAIYDLTGRKIDAITAPGLYIINGVKTIVE